ncbi:MAG: glycosyltransferase family 2 protein [Hyphomonadaceae bacterium]|nr:glycosyltransferase family 2 protein [Hyphomonadaceae bacterium]
MQDNQPIVTLGMPVYNGENFIREAIESILAQTFQDFELIITDNASTDATAAIVEEYVKADPRVQYVHNGKNIGAAANYNVSFNLARGKYMKWCAHDDRISPNFLEACVKHLESDPTLSLAFASTTGINTDGDLVDAEGHETPSLMDPDPSKRFMDAITLAGTCFPIFGLFRMSMLKTSTLHRPYYGSDRGLIAEMAALGKYLRVDEATFYNREHMQRSINIDDKVARSKWQNGTSSRVAAAEHLNLARHLFEIAGRHKNVVSPWKMRRKLSAHIFKPRQVGRYIMELTGIISPRAAQILRSLGTKKQQSTA